MKNYVLLALLTITTMFGQEKKYQSLLWEVSGNGLTKNSYLYGSMHVSDKVSYHLSDAFFTHLLNADIVANESEPSTWSDLFGVLTPDYSRYYNNFYAGFYQQPLTKDQLYPLFQTNNFTLNNLLFRTNEYQKEYQEETYLDMFIYRTGRKYNKKTVGLEDTKTSIISIMSADLGNGKPKEENRAAIQKILKNNGYEEALMNFYRDKDLDMIDSLTTLSSSDSYLKALLYDRNIVMVKSIDSLVRKGSLFAAVGAAHLPGKKGIIEMLRAKGYTVKPVFDNYSDKGKARKQQIEEYFVKPVLKNRATPDGMIELPLFASVIENGNNLESPDLANGGYINVKRMLLRDFMKKDNKPFDAKTLDSLFYENIPGKILEKKFYSQDGYTVYDIKNITKTGKAQRYKYFISPLEVILVSMSGEGTYVRQFENEVYNNIKLKPLTTGWATASPKKGNFTVEMPSYSAGYGERLAGLSGDVEMQAFDSKEKANYFVIEQTLADTETLEDTEFELKRIHYEFYTQLDVDSTNTKLTKQPLSFTSASKIGSKPVKLKSFINGAKYYLLGTVGASEGNTERFFNSFSLKAAVGNGEYRTFTDSTALFTISVPKKENEKLDFINKNVLQKFRDFQQKEELFAPNYDRYEFSLPSGQSISFFHVTSHRYENTKSVDSLLANFRKGVRGENTSDIKDIADIDIDLPVAVEAVSVNQHLNNGGITASTWDEELNSNKKSNKLKIVNEKVVHNQEKNYDQIDLLVVKDESEQAIRYRAIFRSGSSYVLNTLVDKDYNYNDPVIEKVFESFMLLPEIKKAEVADDKLQVFIEDAGSEHDSIRLSALASAENLSITKKDLPKLMRFMEDYDFGSSDAASTLYDMLGSMKNEAVIPFLEKQYKKEEAGTSTRIAILQAMANQESKDAYKKIMELLEYDLPLPDDAYRINFLFSQFGRDPENSQILFPDILQFYTIQEYHQPIADFVAGLLSSKSVRAKKLSGYKKMILTNAKLELKRVKSRKQSMENDKEEYAYYDNNNDTESLITYLDLLYPFRNDKDVKVFFAQSKALQIPKADVELARLDIRSGNLDDKAIEPLLTNKNTLFEVANMLITSKDGAQLKNISDNDLAESALLYQDNVRPAKDSLSFIKKQVVPYNGKEVTFYFYKIIDKRENSYRMKVDKLGAVAFVNSGSRINPLAYKSADMVRIMDEDEIDNYIKATIDGTLNENKTRATFGKVTENGDLLFDDYDDY